MHHIQEQHPDFQWPTHMPTRGIRKFVGTTSRSVMDGVRPKFLDHIEYPSPVRDFQHRPHHDEMATFGDGILTTPKVVIPTQNTPTEPNLLETMANTIIENVTTTIQDAISSISSNLSSESTTPSVGLTENVVSNQTAIQGLSNAETVTANILTTLSTNISSVAPDLDISGAVDTNQTVTQTIISDILTSLSSNVTSVTAGIAEAAETNQTITEAVTSSVLINETTVSDVIGGISSNTSSITTEGVQTTTHELSTTIGSIVKDATDAVVKNVTDIFTTPSNANGTDAHHHYGEVDHNADITIYIILGVIIALLIIGMIVFYFVCKRCKTRYAKSGDYYVTQYSSNSSC